MKFETEGQKNCYERIAPLVKEVFGEFAHANEEIPQFGVALGSSWTNVTVFPWGDDDATITIRAYLVSGAELTPDLLLFLLRKNAEMRFGAFGIDDDNDIMFEHTIVASTCDKTELRASAMAVVNVADKFDDEIVAKWGGTRALDRK